MVRGRGRKARDDLCSRTDPRMRKYVHSPKSLVTREKEDPPTAPERPARGNQVPHSLLARRHGEDPEVRDAEVRSVKPPAATSPGRRGACAGKRSARGPGVQPAWCRGQLQGRSTPAADDPAPPRIASRRPDPAPPRGGGACRPPGPQLATGRVAAGAGSRPALRRGSPRAG